MITMNAVVYKKNGHTYVWAFQDGDEERALEAICKAAHEQSLDFDWDDANLIWQRMAESPEVVEVRDIATYLTSPRRR